MAGGDAEHASGRLLRRTTATSVVLLLVVAGLAFQFDLGPRWLGWDYPSPVDEPAVVAPPPGLDVPDPVAAPVVAEEVESGDADPEAVRRALDGLVDDLHLGRRVAVSVSQLVDGETVFDHGADSLIPASTTKLVTTLAALEALGPAHRFGTTVTVGTSTKEIVLVGGGDPFLAPAPASEDVYPVRADLETLAEGTAKSLRARGRTSVRVRYDISLFEGPAVSPHWRPSYIPDNVVTPVSPLWVDEGVEGGLRSPEPALAAAKVFARALKAEGIEVRGRPSESVAPVDADQLAGVQSAPLDQIVQRVLEVSDNEGAEVLLRHVAIATGHPASFEGGAEAALSVLAELGVDTTGAELYDGSGLSRDNRLSPELLLSVLELAASDDQPDLRSVVADLPVAGFTGSLTYRFEDVPRVALGRVRAKTGTLTGVHGLAGVVTDRQGTELAFVAMTDKVLVRNTLAARSLLDRIAAALADCRCAAPETG